MIVLSRVLVGIALAALFSSAALAAPDASESSKKSTPAKTKAKPDKKTAPAPEATKLREVEKALEKERGESEQLRQKAKALAEEMEKLKAELVAAAREAQGHEETLIGLEGRLAELKGQENVKLAALERRRGQMTDVLAALERMAWSPTEALIAQPAHPADAVRTAILLRAAVPRIENEAASIRNQLTELASLRAGMAKQRERIGSVAVKLDNETGRLNSLLKRKGELQVRTEAESAEAERRVAKLATEASDLRDLLARLENERKEREAALRAKPTPDKSTAGKSAPEKLAALPPARPGAPSGKSFTAARGTLPYPARGRVVFGFGEANTVGHTQKGLSIETRAAAQVIAPYDGHVVFAGQFRGYGLLLIIEHGEGYHTLLAGMDRIDAAVGQTLVAGEPVGIMAQSDEKPTLYVELRQNGQPINPVPWLTAQKDKTNG